MLGEGVILGGLQAVRPLKQRRPIYDIYAATSGIYEQAGRATHCLTLLLSSPHVYFIWYEYFMKATPKGSAMYKKTFLKNISVFEY